MQETHRTCYLGLFANFFALWMLLLHAKWSFGHTFVPHELQHKRFYSTQEKECKPQLFSAQMCRNWFREAPTWNKSTWKHKVFKVQKHTNSGNLGTNSVSPWFLSRELCKSLQCTENILVKKPQRAPPGHLLHIWQNSWGEWPWNEEGVLHVSQSSRISFTVVSPEKNMHSMAHQSLRLQGDKRVVSAPRLKVTGVWEGEWYNGIKTPETSQKWVKQHVFCGLSVVRCLWSQPGSCQLWLADMGLQNKLQLRPWKLHKLNKRSQCMGRRIAAAKPLCFGSFPCLRRVNTKVLFVSLWIQKPALFSPRQRETQQLSNYETTRRKLYENAK